MSPPARTGPGMVYDPRADRVILFGGESGVTLLNDTWAYDLTNNTWTNLTSVHSPPPRAWPEMAYDDDSGKLILFSGMDDPYRLSAAQDTWAYDSASNTWTNLTPSVLATGRYWGNMAYDRAAGLLVLFGGLYSRMTIGFMPFLNDTWTYDYTRNTWMQRHPSEAPNYTGLSGMVYDPRARSVLLYRGLATAFWETSGGAYIVNETWTYDPTADHWTLLSPGGNPPHRNSFGMVYDSSVNRTLLIGGCRWSSTCYSDTWSYDSATETWANVTNGPIPPPRQTPGMAYARNHTTIMFGGGIDGTRLLDPTPLNDTWRYVSSIPPVTSLVIGIEAKPLSGHVPLTVTFNSTVSGGLRPYTYEWSFGDGGHSSEADPTHTYTSAGQYTVTLLISDAGDRSETRSLTVDASSPSAAGSLDAVAVAAAVIVGTGTALLVLYHRVRPKEPEPPP